jgi:enoyl-CoA hydratase
MVREIAVALDSFERDPRVERIVVCGAGARAFSAGGDVRWLYERGRAGDYAAQSTFFREEYALNARIKRYGKPYVSLIDGLVMGGGVGVSLHGADMAALGLATAYVESRRLAALAEALERPGDTEAIIGEFASSPPAAPLLAHVATTETAFAQADAGSVEAALKADGSEFARSLLATMATKSPTSLAIALRQMQMGATLSFEDAMRLEFRIVTRICRAHDFYEGVRAALVDKDNRPQWRPAAGERPDAADIEAYFAPLGADELKLPGGSA